MNKKLIRLVQPGMALYFVILMVFAAAAAVMGVLWDDLRYCYLAGGEAVVIVLAGVYFRVSSVRRRQALTDYVQSAADELESASKGEVPFASVLVRPDTGEIVWHNQRFAELTGIKESMLSTRFSDLFAGANLDWLREGKSEAPEPVRREDRRYRLAGNLLRPREQAQPQVALGALYLVDETQLLYLKDEYVASRPVVSVILVDNYEELINNLPDSNVSNLNAAIDTRIKYWTDGIPGLLRKVERNRYLFVFEAKDLEHLVEQKFSILDSVRAITNPRGIHATLSLGLGKDGATFAEAYSFANLSIEMALARGGDQAVIKDRYNFTFYGGRTKETDRRTKVKSRVMASSLAELITQSSHVFVMGHKNADLDAVGAACGVQAICRKQGKKALLIIDQEKNAAKNLLDKLKVQPEYRGCFITGQDALLMADPKSLLIVVDTNRPDQVECKPLLECISRICVIDHHRRAADYIENAVLNLHEPFASSASELVTELVQYAIDPSELLAVEAQALLSGIVLDTKNFGVRTSSRTFEAAAFLRRLGADTVDVKRILQNDLDATLARYRVIQEARVYRDNIAVAALDHPISRIIAAQAADELLTITGITTSFVLYQDPDEVIISARSFGDTNVQVILEPLGGGGNAATAGAQVRGKPLADVLTELVASIDKYFEAT